MISRLHTSSVRQTVLHPPPPAQNGQLSPHPSPLKRPLPEPRIRLWRWHGAESEQGHTGDAETADKVQIDGESPTLQVV